MLIQLIDFILSRPVIPWIICSFTLLTFLILVLVLEPKPNYLDKSPEYYELMETLKQSKTNLDSAILNIQKTKENLQSINNTLHQTIKTLNPNYQIPDTQSTTSLPPLWDPNTDTEIINTIEATLPFGGNAYLIIND